MQFVDDPEVDLGIRKVRCCFHITRYSWNAQHLQAFRDAGQAYCFAGRVGDMLTGAGGWCCRKWCMACRLGLWPQRL